MSYFAYLYYKNGYTVYSNYNLSFPHIKLTKDIILEYTMSRKQFEKSVFCIDEIYLFFDSRNFSKNANRIFSYFLVQSSKNNVHIFGTAQFLNTIEKRFRENLTFRCFCQRVVYDTILKKYNDVENHIRFLPQFMLNNLYIKNVFLIKSQNMFSESFKSNVYYLKSQECFNLYDTKELISLTD